jgi:DinB superfamily
MAIPQLEAEAIAARMARERFVYGLSKVPDDRLNWSPAETAKTPLQIAGALAAGILSFFVPIIATKTLPSMEGGRGALPTSREEVNAALTNAFDALNAAIDGTKAEDLSHPIPTPGMPGGTLTLAGWIGMALAVCSYFQGQLNYVQTAYGDLDPNLPDLSL